MGKAGRFACIIVPFLLTLASLICILLVFAGQTNKGNSIANDLYFFKADTSKFNADPNQKLDNVNVDNKILEALRTSATTNELKDFYKVGLWNFCEGEVKDNKEDVQSCSARQANYWFDPTKEWELKNTTLQNALGDKMQNGLDAYRKVAKWMFAAFVISACLTAAELVVGIFAIFSRWGSFVTTIVSSAQTFFVIGAAITSTALYGSLVGIFHSVLRPYKIEASMGTKMLAILWIGVAFSLASSFFWLISVCCCSGKSPHKRVQVEKTPYTYERVASPYMGHSAQGGHDMHNLPPAGHTTTGSAYEPYRAAHV